MAEAGCELVQQHNDGREKADIRQIIYVSIMGSVMLLAFLEWFLWLAAFIYCLVKVFQKAEHYTIRLLAIVMIILFTALRYVRANYHYVAWKLT